MIFLVILMGRQATNKKTRREQEKARTAHGLLYSFLIAIRKSEVCEQQICSCSHWKNKVLFAVPYQFLYDYARENNVLPNKLELLLHGEGLLAECTVEGEPCNKRFIAVTVQGVRKLDELKTPVHAN